METFCCVFCSVKFCWKSSFQPFFPSLMLILNLAVFSLSEQNRIIPVIFQRLNMFSLIDQRFQCVNFCGCATAVFITCVCIAFFFFYIIFFFFAFFFFLYCFLNAAEHSHIFLLRFQCTNPNSHRLCIGKDINYMKLSN